MAAILLTENESHRKRRVFRHRTADIDDLSEQEAQAHYRLTKRAIIELEELCRDDLSPKTDRSCSIQSMTKVLIGLRFLAKGDFLFEVADLHGVSKAAAAVVIDDFVGSVNKRLKNIRFPTNTQDVNEIKRQFYRRCRIPNVIAAIDGTLIPIVAPSVNEAAYVCRKNYHALNVQAVCDPDMRFTDVVAMWPGSQHDSAIFNSCGLKNYLEMNGIGMLLADSGYPLRRYLLTPKLNPRTPQEESFNTSQSKGRMVIEKAFGILKSRFRCLHKSGGVLQFRPGKCSQVVLAYMRLHNLCISRNVPEPAVIVQDDDNNVPYLHNNAGVENFRQDIINMF